MLPRNNNVRRGSGRWRPGSGVSDVSPVARGGFLGGRDPWDGRARVGSSVFTEGVYVLGALSPAPEQRWAAALLAGGKGAVLSHTAAAAHFGWLQPREVVEVSAPRRRRGDERLRIHERRSIEITRRNGLPTTTPAQTLLDLAAAGWSIDRFTQEAAATGLIPLNDLRTFAAQRRGERGAGKAADAAGQPLVRSRTEYEALKKLGIPHVNERVAGEEVDLAWGNFVVELDHDQTHGDPVPPARERDAQQYVICRVQHLHKQMSHSVKFLERENFRIPGDQYSEAGEN